MQAFLDQPFIGDLDLCYPHGQVQDWHLVVQFRVGGWIITFGLNVLHYGVCDALQLFHGDLILLHVELSPLADGGGLGSQNYRRRHWSEEY